jgi:hypothetical protein
MWFFAEGDPKQIIPEQLQIDTIVMRFYTSLRGSVVALLLSSTVLMAQPTTTAPALPFVPPPPKIDNSYRPLMLTLNQDSSKYVRFIMWHQFWATATQNNPGTTDIVGEKIDGSNGKKAWSTDIALRRSRFLAYAQISPRMLILTHWGINNQSFIGGATNSNGSNITGASNAGKKPHLFIHDAWTEFEIMKDKLSIGTGLHYFNGLSRSSMASTLNFMTLDAPIFNWQNIEVTDQLARQFGFFAKGFLGKFEYRLALNKPFASGVTPAAAARSTAAVNVLNENWANMGYFSYNFWDKENTKLPYYVGSYLGSKKVLNLGAGWYNHNKASIYKSSINTDSLLQDHRHFSVDVTLEKPLNKVKGTALSAYAVAYSMNFGTNYLRSFGILNLHPTSTMGESRAGGGNAQYTIGTGTIGYAQVGYLLPRFKDGSSFMPYGTFTYKDFDGLPVATTQFGLGINYFVVGHNAKITLEYQTRPVFGITGTTVVRDGSKGEFILQTHIYL